MDNNVWKEVSWKSPSNIAIVKYWGKHGNQLPNNPSLSLTLSQCYSSTSIRFRESDQLAVSFLFEGVENTAFSQRIEKFLHSILQQMPFLAQLEMVINSANSFPHSAGIASSASSMSALALGLCSVEETVSGKTYTKDEFLKKASILARLASGSASRSVYGGYVEWGEHASFAGSSNMCSSRVEEIHPVFENWYDAVLIVHKGKKNFSSTKGHTMMSENPYSAIRYQQANENLGRLLQILKEGDVEAFIELTEIEALTLHAMMMTSGIGYFEMKPNSLKIMELIRVFRKDTGVKLAFTLDAGPNIHLLYAPDEREKVLPFIKNQLAPFCQNEMWIDDHIGQGPEKIG